MGLRCHAKILELDFVGKPLKDFNSKLKWRSDKIRAARWSGDSFSCVQMGQRNFRH